MTKSSSSPRAREFAQTTGTKPQALGEGLRNLWAGVQAPPQNGQVPRVLRRHLQYPDPTKPDQPEVTAIVCLPATTGFRGTGGVFNHPLNPRDMTPRQRAEAPFWFASAVVSLYENKLIIPQIEKELAVRQNLIKGRVRHNPQAGGDPLSDTKLCPYRVAAMVNNDFYALSDDAIHSKWALCLQDKCQMWRDTKMIRGDASNLYVKGEFGWGWCGLAGKP